IIVFLVNVPHTDNAMIQTKPTSNTLKMLFIMKLRGGVYLIKQGGLLLEYFLFIKSLYLD
ncbi:hypothetical protein KU489_16835, partial [Salmonella enterica subsp. enterica serovar Reading]|nr:hypothetical protein [Salmonella enterica subsp. enterica serovar Reading]